MGLPCHSRKQWGVLRRQRGDSSMFQQDGRRGRVVERDSMKELSKTILAKRDIKTN